MATKFCNGCQSEKDASEFYSSKTGKGCKLGLVARCKPCMREAARKWNAVPRNRERRNAQRREWTAQNRDRTREYMRRASLKRLYGITVEVYNQMLEAQDGVCAICWREETHVQKGTIRNLCVDHDHETGQVRQLLCHYCNTLLGHAQDDPEVLRSAAEYVETHQATEVEA